MQAQAVGMILQGRRAVVEEPIRVAVPGAFTGLAASDQIDWTSDTFENFVKLPEQHPLIGAGFAKDPGTDLLAAYQAGFGFGPFSIEPLAALPTDGTFTFWWKEGANRTEYRLNFVVSAE